jgi:chorismate dehydratase
MRLRRLDLAAEWRYHTGLPFVFAVWAGRGERVRNEARPVLLEAYARGLEHLGEIVAGAAKALGLAPARVGEYLREHLHYTFSSEEARGLRLFLEKAVGEEIESERLDVAT